MTHRVVVNVATDSWAQMQARLVAGLQELGEHTLCWTNALPLCCPPHRTGGTVAARREEDCRPYAFKSYAMRDAQGRGFTSILWCDSCIVPQKPLEPIWQRIESNGVWICRNGWNNAEWTADSAYPDLFPECYHVGDAGDFCMESAREQNRQIPHVVATVFGVSTAHPQGAALLAEYFRLASETRAFCGPWQNSAAPRERGRNNQRTSGLCGPSWVHGHRHDQTALSVIAWRLGVELDDPGWFSYDPRPDCILLAKGEI